MQLDQGLRAATSLKKTFTDFGEQFKTENPGASVEFLLAGSSDLVTQLTQGADADVFASAGLQNHGQGGAGRELASNTLAGVATRLLEEDRVVQRPTQQGLNVVVCAPQVPCGSATRKVEQASAGVKMNPVSEESSVSDVLNRVTTGQADAGLVYVTEDRAGRSTRNPIAVLKGSENPELARKFVDLVTGESGQKVLSAAGFAKP